LTNCYQLALPKNREATYPLAESADSGLAPGPSYQLLGLAGGGVCPAEAVTGSAVRSYRTISPLPPLLLSQESAGAVYFLWHFPWSTEGEPVAVSHHRCPVLLGLSSPAASLLRSKTAGATARPTLSNHFKYRK